jgi:hypothetical protein
MALGGVLVTASPEEPFVRCWEVWRDEAYTLALAAPGRSAAQSRHERVALLQAKVRLNTRRYRSACVRGAVVVPRRRCRAGAVAVRPEASSARALRSSGRRRAEADSASIRPPARLTRP